MEERRPESNDDEGSGLSTASHCEAMRADHPCMQPSDDKFGYMPTAKRIAQTAMNAPASHGLVLHVDGEWGSGKSSMLGLVNSVLTTAAPPGQSAAQVIWFNPWWFSDHEHLVQQFFSEFQKKLPHENNVLMAAGRAIAEYSDALSDVVATGAGSLGLPQVGLLKNFLSWCFRKLSPPKKDVGGLRAEIAEKLSEARQRFVVFIDDIDRLTPAEINQVFRVIKAVADFPNVVYILAFDRDVVARALESEHGAINGSAYLEKIIQVPFVLPTLRPDQLRDLLIADVRESAPEVQFDDSGDMYETNVLDAMGNLVRHPRDLVRFTNAFAPTYAGLRGDVLAVDVAAMELLRVVEPKAYRAIRNDETSFAGNPIGRDGTPGDDHEPRRRSGLPGCRRGGELPYGAF